MIREDQVRQELVRLGRSLYERGLTPGSSGNLSVRLENGILITPTNSCLGRLDPGTLSLVKPSGDHVAGDRPSKELPLHLALYEQYPGERAVAHLHSTHAVAVSTLGGLDPSDALPPITAYYVMRVGQLPLVGYYPPGDRSLTEAVRKAARQNRSMLLANHGSIAVASSLAAALDVVEEIEETARLFLLLEGRVTSFLSAAAKNALL